jgi:hypothetical protein
VIHAQPSKAAPPMNGKIILRDFVSKNSAAPHTTTMKNPMLGM